MPLRLLLSLVLVLGSLVQPLAAQHAIHDGQNRFDLFERSLKTSSPSERAMIRGYLAQSHADTPEGLFSAAWIAGRDGRARDEIRLYEAAIEADPELTTAYINLALAHEQAARPEAARDLYDKALATAPFDPDLVRNGFFLRKAHFGGRPAAMDFLAKWEAEVGSLDYAFDFVRALDAEAGGQHEEAEKLYQSAIAKDGSFEVYERLARLQLKKYTADTTPAAERLAHVTRVLAPLLEPDGNAAAYYLIGRMIRDDLDSSRTAITFLKAGFDLDPSAETAEEIFLAMSLHDAAAAVAFLQDAERKLPESYSLKLSMAWMHSSFLAHPDEATGLAHQAYALAPHDDGRLQALLMLGNIAQSYANFDAAYEVFREKLALPWAPQRRRQLLRAMVDNRIGAQKFNQANAHLDELKALGGEAEKWLSWKFSVTANALRLQRQMQEPRIVERPLAIRSREKVSVGFAFGSDGLSRKGLAQLDEVAAFLKSARGAGLSLSIEGHTDAAGSAAVNDSLSLRRARSVLTYLTLTHGIEAGRLQVSGFGSRFPAASNSSRKGRSVNRRAELRPLPADSPSSASLALADRGSAFDPGAYRAVLGSEPPQIHDLRTMVPLVRLYRGRDHRFSPDGRYVASISSYREESGHATEAAYVYDASTGHAVAQLHEALEIVDLVWRPDGGAIAYATADGFLKLYDIKAAAFTAVTRMGPTRIGGPLAWFPDGSALASGQHRLQEITIHDPRTLAERRRLQGVQWPHALGVSPDGRFLLAFDNRLDMSVWETGSWAGPQQVRVPMIPYRLVFHPDLPLVAFNARFEANGTAFTVMNFEQLRTTATWPGRGSHAIGLSAAGDSVLAASGTDHLVFSLPSLKLLRGFRAQETTTDARD